MSDWRDAVAAWNARHKTNEPQEECPKCQQPRGIVIEVVGKDTKTAACSCCGFAWVVV